MRSLSLHITSASDSCIWSFVLGSIQGRSGNHFDQVQKKVAKFADHMNVLVGKPWHSVAR